MDDNNILSEETLEVADPENEVIESEENLEAADPDEAEEPTEVTEEEEQESQDSYEDDAKAKSDAAFAEMRRQKEALEQDNKAMEEALRLYFEGEDANDLSVQAQAYAQDKDPEVVQQELEKARMYENALNENEALKEQLENIQVEKLMKESLEQIQSIDPSVKALEDLGDTFVNCIGAGLDATTAYYAAKARELKEKVNPPSNIGKVNNVKGENEYYTSEELDNMSKEEIDKNWDKVMKSMDRLGK